MGVTLERVQNKFACIIGELCSEPDVLSQFAIWLDLRLAEYKAKGAISLEISGEDPDPTWLRGHKPAPPGGQRDITADMYNPTGGGDLKFDTETVLGEVCHERLSPDVVVVKEEPEAEHVFPVSLHLHDSSPSLNSQKRKHSESVYSSGSRLHHTPLSASTPSAAKIHRPSHSSSVTEPVNQSLMSIITAEFHEQDTGNTSTDTSRLESSQLKGDNFLSGFVAPASGSSTSHSHLPGSSNSESQPASDSTEQAGSYMYMYTRTKPGVYKPEIAERHGMVELLQGSGVFLHSDQFHTAVSKSVGLNGAPGDGKKVARYLLTVFFSTAELSSGSLGGESSLYPPLNQKIITAITAESWLADQVSFESKHLGDIYSSLLHVRQKSWRTWSQEDMEKALAAVQSGELSQRAASRRFNIPQTTIHRRLLAQGRQPEQNLPGK